MVAREMPDVPSVSCTRTAVSTGRPITVRAHPATCRRGLNGPGSRVTTGSVSPTGWGRGGGVYPTAGGRHAGGSPGVSSASGRLHAADGTSADVDVRTAGGV